MCNHVREIRTGDWQVADVHVELGPTVWDESELTLVAKTAVNRSHFGPARRVQKGDRLDEQAVGKQAEEPRRRMALFLDSGHQPDSQ
ncbi:Hypothetical protein NTJ_04889 [Nesidiocoris tenuis]|uniref:Uncharacterized protein n=1 Tax=Nesidiocoris tenuis TaxID=355587 RepID=A0ABN7AIJ4_9HEMI|nr:Hypothetical protein NTJ_04889 [Nesidiocoris tenuis]